MPWPASKSDTRTRDAGDLQLHRDPQGLRSRLGRYEIQLGDVRSWCDSFDSSCVGDEVANGAAAGFFFTRLTLPHALNWVVDLPELSKVMGANVT